MLIFKTQQDLEQELKKHSGKVIGFVPTMGALHDGHISLIKKSKQTAEITVCSVFVNPTQFNDKSDFEKYPVTIHEDIALLESVNCDILFLPSVQAMYPGGMELKTKYQLGFLENILEGEFRPGHFQGVCQVVDNLLQMVMPDYLIMGAKDYQQCMVIQKLLQSKQEFSKIKLVISPIVREGSGLAKSSRNKRLSENDLTKATAIFKALHFVKDNLRKGNIHSLLQQATEQLLGAGFEKIDYVAIADANSFELINNWNEKQNAVILIAAFLNGVRLIDNIVVTE